MRKFLVVGLFILTASCATSAGMQAPSGSPLAESTVGDGGFLSLKPCGPPCFYGVVPGMASEADVARAQQDFGSVFSHCDLIDNTSEGGSRGLGCDHGIGVGYDDGAVDGIGFSPAVPITVEQVVAQYGPPDEVSVFSVSLPDSPPRVGADLSYSRLRAFLGLPEQAGREFEITPTTKITQIAYYSDAMYQQLRGASADTGVPWRGFGTYISSP